MNPQIGSSLPFPRSYWNGNVGFEERKTGIPSEERTTNLTYIWRCFWDVNLGHIGKRSHRAPTLLSLLSHTATYSFFYSICLIYLSFQSLGKGLILFDMQFPLLP